MTLTPGSASPNSRPFSIHIPNGIDHCDQTEEWFVLESAGSSCKLRIQDYPAVYGVPGLYEAIVYDTLKCCSHKRFADLLGRTLAERGDSGRNVSILELGAGNGVVGEELKGLDISRLTGLDLLAEARDAAFRDRPNVYDEYVVADLMNDNPLDGQTFDALVVVSALGLGGIPPTAFMQAAKLVKSGGLIGLTFKSEFLDANNKHEFGVLLRKLLNLGLIELEAFQRYRHRYSTTGESIRYVALIAKKVKEFPTPQHLSLPNVSVQRDHFAVLQGAA